METIHMIISGRVQGVFYRYNATRKADELGLRGYAKNLPDGTVEVVAQGDKYSLLELRDFCTVGKGAASVENVDFNWVEDSAVYTSFEEL